MSTPLTTEGPLKSFRLSELDPRILRLGAESFANSVHAEIERAAGDGASREGVRLRGFQALDEVVMVEQIAMFPFLHDDGPHFVSLKAWERMEAEVARMDKAEAKERKRKAKQRARRAREPVAA